MLHKTNKCNEMLSMVIREDWVVSCHDVKDQFVFLLHKGDKIFIAQNIMNVISIIYLQYWVQPKVTPMTFLEHLQIKKSHY
jgi:hypothetical protein